MKRNACQKCVFAVNDNKPHCGLRGFRSDFNIEYCSAENNTVPNGYELQEDGYFSWVKKKKEYPKTYEECYQVTGLSKTSDIYGYKNGLLFEFQKLLIARDAYWKIAGEELELGKPWEPDWKNSEEKRYCIVNIEGDINLPEKVLTKWILKVTNKILVFPTAEMRDAFYEAFKKEIEICKELL